MCTYELSIVFFFKQKTAYELRISDWSSDVCSSDLRDGPDAIAGFRGTGGYLAAASTMMVAEFVKAVGSYKMFSTLTIDQSAKMVSIGDRKSTRLNSSH